MGCALVTVVEEHYFAVPMGDLPIPEDWALPFTDPEGGYWTSFEHYVDYYHDDAVKNTGGGHLVSRKTTSHYYQR